MRKPEEHLPLHPSSSSPDEPPCPIPQPSPSASPATVRTYIASLLTTNRSLTPTHAQSIAAKWTLGQGRELRAYPAAMFLSIFGREDGWAVCREVKLRIYEEEAAERKGKEGTVKARLLVAAVCAGEGAALPLFVWSLINEYMGLAAVGLVILVVLSPFFCAIVAAAVEDGPERRVERELREGVKSAARAS